MLSAHISITHPIDLKFSRILFKKNRFFF
ncbi:unknown protein [Simkania negevensis Z]|uniref:Uncharacterized protein n=1 Tax=Simkania negevensis (strain ATCC VR-1471 / DSM 27360 / Z) TaxID=331113 RepID=F8L3K9_SIMNZ|nr:unknown protein [Simkania negevensis Z]